MGVSFLGGGFIIQRNDRWMLRGIISIGKGDLDTGKCNKAKYAIFTDVALFLPWIENHVRRFLKSTLGHA